jgi:multidrug efflux pump subunit AcrA (membrane-fusion protein)
VQAVLNEGPAAVVVVVGDGNIFRARKVDVGPEADGHLRVFAGLQAGERIVTDGALFLKSEIDGH